MHFWMGTRRTTRGTEWNEKKMVGIIGDNDDNKEVRQERGLSGTSLGNDRAPGGITELWKLSKQT